ncbi:MAG: UbiD family decarboxylase domain-containing protein [Planctomycetota bacterium]
MYRDLRQFVSDLERMGELVRITDPVDPVLDIAAIADQISEARAPSPPSRASQANDPAFFGQGGPAVLFENPVGSSTPVLINAYGSYRRMELALGCDADPHTGSGLDGLAKKIGELAKPQPPRGLSEAIDKAKQFAPLLKIGPKRSKSPGLCQQVEHVGDAIDLTGLPILRCWPLDGDFEAVGYPKGVNDAVPGLGHPDIAPDEWDARHRGRYITLAGIHTIHADDRDDPKPASHNIGMYRVQLLGKDRVAMHWHVHHDGARHWRSWKKLGQPMPVAIVLGGEAVLPYAATAPLPPGISELLMAGFLNKGGIKLCRGKTVPLWIPANAEIVIEGFVRTDAGVIDWDPRDPNSGELGDGSVFEGPFGDHTGFYSLPDRYPVVEVSAVTTRENPIYPATVVGLPPQEDYFLGKATERLFRYLLQVLIPDVEDYDLPMFGAFHNCAFVKIKKAYPLQARRVMHAIWGAGQMAWTKSIFVVDDDVDVHDAKAVLEACAKNCDPSRDVELVRGPLDILDHASPHLAAGSKIGFDCTRRWTNEEAGKGPLPQHCERVLAGGDLEAFDANIVRTIDGVLDAAIPGTSPGWLIVKVDRGFDEPERAGLGRAVATRILEVLPELGPSVAPPYVVVVGRDVDLEDPVLPFFHWLANSDPARDIFRATGSCPIAVFDATPKTEQDTEHAPEPVRPWPPVLEIDADSRDRVSELVSRLTGQS